MAALAAQCFLTPAPAPHVLACCTQADTVTRMSVLGEAIDKTGDLILRLWERGQNFFWAVGSVGTASFLILLTGWWFDLGAGPDLFRTYGFLALIVAIGGVIFGAWRKAEDRPKPTVYLMPDKPLSFWAQSRQLNGEVHTQYCFRMQATNLTDDPVKLSILRLVRPRIKRGHVEPKCYVHMRGPAIMPRATSEVSCDVIVNGPIGEPAKRSLPWWKFQTSAGNGIS